MNRKFPVESDILTVQGFVDTVLFNTGKGTPELNDNPALFPKYQLFHSPCE
jgi:hypothetical protein